MTKRTGVLAAVLSSALGGVAAAATRFVIGGTEPQHARCAPASAWASCSFMVMKDQGLQQALTADLHFVQAGFQALLRG